MKKIAVILASILFIVDLPARDDPRAVRDALFKCAYVINKSHTLVHASILKRIDFCRADSKTIPSLALSSIKKVDRTSKDEREMFIKSIVAVMKSVNKAIMEHRSIVIAAKHRGKSKLSEDQAKKFKMICSFYQTSDINELLRRVAPVPISLAAAQAALESGFGSDNFIHDRNAYFGMMKNQKELYSFDTLFEAAIAYTKTLNVNKNYRRFRAERLKMLKTSKKIDGMRLCAYIEKYCVRKIYRRRVLHLIKEYRLQNQDQSYRYYG